MKKFLLSIVVLATTIMPAMAKWVKCNIKDLTATDVVVIVDQTSACAMPNDNGTSKAPQATAITFNSDKSELTGEISENLKWNIVIGSTSNTYSIYPNGTTETWLYSTNSNNGIRVGSNAENKYFSWTNGYLKNINLGRYMGVYKNQDWRTYTTIHDNIKATVTAFYKYEEGETVVTQVSTPTITPNGGEITVNTQISIACATEGASIYYTIDGSEPSAENGTLYEAPFTLAESESTTVKAIAVKTDLDNSGVTEAVFTVWGLLDYSYELVKSVVAGGHYIIVGENNGEYYAIGEQNDNNRKAVNVINNNGKIEYPQVNVCEFELSGSEGAWSFFDPTNNGYLYAASSGSNYLKTQETLDDNGKATIEFDENGVATIKFQGTNTINWLRYNNGNKLFSCYGETSTQKDVCLYQRVGEVPTAIEEVGVEANAPVEYYNLQGVKVARPENGIFIKKQGSKATKVVL